MNIDGTMFYYDDAKQPVKITRTLMDVFRGKPGVAGECMNAQCIIRNKAKFPHKVLGVSVVKSRVYVIDTPEHAVRYTLGEKDSLLIANHDENAIGQPGELTLRVPRIKKGTSTSGTSWGDRKNKARRGKGKPLPRGERARIKAAVGVA